MIIGSSLHASRDVQGLTLPSLQLNMTLSSDTGTVCVWLTQNLEMHVKNNMPAFAPRWSKDKSQWLLRMQWHKHKDHCSGISTWYNLPGRQFESMSQEPQRCSKLKKKSTEIPMWNLYVEISPQRFLYQYAILFIYNRWSRKVEHGWKIF